MGILESRPAQSPATPSSSPTETPSQQNDEQFKTEVRKSAENFKNLVMNNKIMMFSATYCSYCTVAKVERESWLWLLFTLLVFSELLTTWVPSFKAWRWTRRAATGRWWWTSWRLWRGTGWCRPSSSVVSSSRAGARASNTWPARASCQRSWASAVRETSPARNLTSTASTSPAGRQD